MASVTGITSEYAESQFNTMIVSGAINQTTGELFLYPKVGDPINAGPVIAPKLAVEKAWPVGSIFVTTVNTNPYALMGIGTWARFGQGRTLIGLDETDVDFDVTGEVGGVKTVTLTGAQSGIPIHSHTASTASAGVDAQFNTTLAGSNPLSDAVIARGSGSGDLNRQIAGSPHTHAVTVNPSAAANAAAPHSVVQPYIVVYMWKRTA